MSRELETSPKPGLMTESPSQARPADSSKECLEGTVGARGRRRQWRQGGNQFFNCDRAKVGKGHGAEQQRKCGKGRPRVNQHGSNSPQSRSGRNHYA